MSNRFRHGLPTIVRLVAAAVAVTIAGCSTLVGLDDLRLEADASRGVDTESGAAAPADARGDALPSTSPDATIHDTLLADAAIDVSDAPDTKPSRRADAGDAGAGDSGDDELCRLTGKCPCAVDPDCRAGFTCCSGRCADLSTEPSHCGACGTACTDGRVCVQGDCTCGDLDPLCAAVCIDFFADPQHCGRCGHSCMGGDCIGGACQPVLLASQQEGTSAIAVDANSVFFANADGNTVGRVAKIGPPCVGSGCLLVTSPLLADPRAIAANASGAFVASRGAGDAGAIARVEPGLASVTALVASEGATTIAVSAGRVLWGSARGTTVVGAVPATGGDAVPLAVSSAGRTFVAALAADAQSVVFGVSPPSLPPGLPSGIFHLTLGQPACVDGACRPVATLDAAPQGFALRDDWLYWTSADGTVRKVVKTGGCDGIQPCPVVLAENQADPRGIVVAGGQAYWVNAGDGTVRVGSIYRKCRGPHCQAIAGRLGRVVAIAQDADALYVGTRGTGPGTGSVWKLAK